MPEKFPLISPQGLQKMIPVFLGVEANQSDLEKPSPEFTQAVYESIVQLFIGPLTFEYSTIQDIEFPEMHVDSGPRLEFFLQVQSILNRLTVRDFCYEDLIKPESERFVKQMSGVVNFLKFRAERLKLLQKYECSQIEINEDQNKLEQNLKLKERDLNQLKQAYEEECRKAEAMDPERQQKRQQCVTLSKQHNHLTQQQNTLRSSVNRLKDNLDTATFELNAKIREREEVEGLIVEPPDVIEEGIQMITQKLNETRDFTAHTLARDSKLREAIHVITKYGSDTEKDMELLKEIEAIQSENKNLSLNLSEMKRILEEGSLKHEDKRKQVESLATALTGLSKELQNEKEQFDLIQKELDSALLQKETERCQAEEENNEIEKSVVAQSNAQVQEVLEKIKVLQEHHQNQIEELNAKGKILEERFLLWSKTI